ncbi:MAG TPA: ECF transporter S component [Candidatus Deferrimicrobium sp.]|nr:ECF transporter S component [Candidatus Deferrimicrobium sp.]
MGFLQNYLPSYPRTLNIALASIFAALVCVATILFKIPVPATEGYFNIGEIFIYIAAILFGPIIGGFAGGVGAGLADALSGYLNFAPATLIIKFCEGFFIGFIIFKLRLKYWEGWRKRWLLSGIVVVGGLIMVIGYFIYETILYGLIPALGEVPINFIQLGIGLIVAVPASIGIQIAYPIIEFPSKEVN